MAHLRLLASPLPRVHTQPVIIQLRDGAIVWFELEWRSRWHRGPAMHTTMRSAAHPERAPHSVDQLGHGSHVEEGPLEHEKEEITHNERTGNYDNQQ